jgi:hypothetical protein
MGEADPPASTRGARLTITPNHCRPRFTLPLPYNRAMPTRSSDWMKQAPAEPDMEEFLNLAETSFSWHREINLGRDL